MKNVSKVVFDALNSTVQNLGFELYDVEYAKKNNGMNLTLFITNENGITINDCELVHHTVDPILDELDPTDGAPYTLNVSSLGLDRPLKTEKDFLHNIGKQVEIKLFTPISEKKQLVAKIEDFKENTLICSAEETLQIPLKNIALCKLHLDF